MRSLIELYRRFAHLIFELFKFGTVGAISAVVDIGGNNLLRFGLEWGPLTSKTVSTVVATIVAYLGNRFWTFRHRDRTGLAREYFLFFVLNGIGLLIALLCVGFTHYTLKLHGPLAYNISANVVGLGLGTAFRYWSYKKWVFLPPALPEIDPYTGLPDARQAADSAAASGATRTADGAVTVGSGGAPASARGGDGVNGHPVPGHPTTPMMWELLESRSRDITRAR